MQPAFSEPSAEKTVSGRIRRSGDSKTIQLSAKVDKDHRVHLTLRSGRSEKIRTLTVYRSFNDLSEMRSLDLDAWPITKTVISYPVNSEEIIDSFAAHHTIYTYYIKAELTDGAVVPSTVATVSIPDLYLPDSPYPVSLFVDKCHYYLEIRFRGTPVKRFPINMGIKPRNRKLYFDRSSTPEGVYKAGYLRRTSDFHKAIGITYPNRTDRKRYYAACRKGLVPLNNGKPLSIGGSIQIHGGGIGNNWTWGCIAMRNDDLDEIFSLSAFRSGIPITIVGTEFTRDSIAASDTM